jgi:hypothetical protein
VLLSSSFYGRNLRFVELFGRAELEYCLLYVVGVYGICEDVVVGIGKS